MIETLSKKLKCNVGYSGHETHVSPSITAFFLGAKYIERHITLDRAMWGTDQASSLSENGMKNLSNVVKKINKSLGSGKKHFQKKKKLIKKI